MGHGRSLLTPVFVSSSSHISTAIDKINARVMGHGSLIARPFDPSINLWSLVVATLVWLVTNAGFRRPGYEGRDMAVQSIQQRVSSFINASPSPPRS